MDNYKLKKPKSIYFISIWTFFLFSFQKNTIFLVLFGTIRLSNEMQIISVLIFGVIVFLLIFGLLKLNKVAVYTLITLFIINNISIFLNPSSVMNNKYGFAAFGVVIFIFLVNSVSIYFLVNHRFRLLIKEIYEEKNKDKSLPKERSANPYKTVIPKTNMQIGLGYFFTIIAGFIVMGLLITPNILKRMDLISLFISGASSIAMFYFGRTNLNPGQWKKLMKYLLIGLASLIFIEAIITIYNLLFIENRLPQYTSDRIVWLLVMCVLFFLVGIIVGNETSEDNKKVGQ